MHAMSGKRFLFESYIRACIARYVIAVFVAENLHENFYPTVGKFCSLCIIDERKTETLKVAAGKRSTSSRRILYREKLFRRKIRFATKARRQQRKARNF